MIIYKLSVKHQQYTVLHTHCLALPAMPVYELRYLFLYNRHKCVLTIQCLLEWWGFSTAMWFVSCKLFVFFIFAVIKYHRRQMLDTTGNMSSFWTTNFLAVLYKACLLSIWCKVLLKHQKPAIQLDVNVTCLDNTLSYVTQRVQQLKLDQY